MSFSYTRAELAQERMRGKVVLKPLGNIRTVSGCDLTFLNPFRTPTLGIACYVTLDFPSLEVIEVKHLSMEVSIPYVPGFLAFREVPLLIRTYLSLSIKPDVVIVDGQGIAHPRGLGLATHLGVALNIPTVGCAKKPLYGNFEAPCERRGCFSYITDPKTGSVIGTVLRTKDRVKPVFVSPGNLSDVETSKNLVLECSKGYRLPEPTRLAHNVLKSVRRQML